MALGVSVWKALGGNGPVMRSVMDRKKTTAFYALLLNARPGPGLLLPAPTPRSAQTGETHGKAVEPLC